jgi:hypothetical protein
MFHAFIYAARKYGPSGKLLNAAVNWGEEIAVVFLLARADFNSSSSAQLPSDLPLKIIAWSF